MEVIVGPVCASLVSVCLSVSKITEKRSSDFVETWCYDWAFQTEKLITFDGDQVLDMDSGSFFNSLAIAG